MTAHSVRYICYLTVYRVYTYMMIPNTDKNHTHPNTVDKEIWEGNDCWYCGEPLAEGTPVSVQALFLAHEECRLEA